VTGVNRPSFPGLLRLYLVGVDRDEIRAPWRYCAPWRDGLLRSELGGDGFDAGIGLELALIRQSCLDSSGEDEPVILRRRREASK